MVPSTLKPPKLQRSQLPHPSNAPGDLKEGQPFWKHNKPISCVGGEGLLKVLRGPSNREGMTNNSNRNQVIPCHVLRLLKQRVRKHWEARSKSEGWGAFHKLVSVLEYRTWTLSRGHFWDSDTPSVTGKAWDNSVMNRILFPAPSLGINTGTFWRDGVFKDCPRWWKETCKQLRRWRYGGKNTKTSFLPPDSRASAT